MAGLPTNSSSKQQHVVQQWQQLFNTAAPRSPEAEQHWQQVLRLGLPHRKLEHWKYTPLDSLLSHVFTVPTARFISPELRNMLALPVDSWRLVFVDGVFNAMLSDVAWGPYQIDVKPAGSPLSLSVAIQPEVFLHLTESLAMSTTLIHLPAGVQADKPLYLLHINSSGSTPVLNTVHYRHHLSVGQGASAQIIEHYVSLDEGAHFCGARLTIDAGENSQVTHYKLGFESPASYHFSHNDLLLARAAQVSSHGFLLGAGLMRHHTSAQINGEGVNLVMNSLVLPGGNEVCDTRTYLEHNKGHGESRQLHKTIVRDRARAVFNGTIKVAPQALKTDGKMTNNNLLLGRLAEVDTKPQLEIYADDVKCSHGATVGRIDEEQLFYLRSRGISERDAQQMIIFAFAAELTEAITDEVLRDVVVSRIALRLEKTMGGAA
ncbi:Fe-S cluster assembly protein SufD [Pectobacteriaceae bacterium CE70]|nr:Fe-S cluster assembly protein SufD [Pectobacteriaceae bacterium C52]WJV68727.1 Fe-S cluster assembly protein SufD [Pectobacteriaceae bacterium CE70]WJY12653.1 Fe-S cluster assembly protein SufD [Pectobacteriaceae bacterium C80]